MENSLILRPDNTPEAQQALALHYEIKSSLATMAGVMVEFCRQLKSMRDQRLYTHLGFETFEDYVEKRQGIGQRQAYNYIRTYEKLGPKLIEENADVGITKLSLLTKISAPDREDFVADNDLANISVSELKRLIEERNGLAEQVSLLSNEPVDAASIDVDLAEQIRRDTEHEVRKQYQDEIQQYKNDMEEMSAKHEKETKAAVKEAVKKEKEKAAANLEKEKQAAADRAVKRASEKLEAEFKEKNAETIATLAAVQDKADKLEKELKLNSDKDTVKFGILFSAVQNDIDQLEQLIKNIERKDAGTAGKLKTALGRLFGQKAEKYKEV